MNLLDLLTIDETEIAHDAAADLLDLLAGSSEWATLIQQLSWLHVALEVQLNAMTPLVDVSSEVVSA